MAAKLFGIFGSLVLSFLLAGCGGGSSAGGFAVSGQLVSTSVSSLIRTSFGDVHAVTTGTVTHVMAVNPSSANSERIVAAIGDHGSFSLNLTGGRPYILVFLDSTKVGKNMILGIFTTATLHTLPPATPTGSLVLSNVGIASGSATSDIGYDALLSALGLDAPTATTIGALDGLCLRYVNPDIDGDGTIDALQVHHNFGLDFHVRFNMKQGGVAATVGSILGNFLDATTTTAEYGSTGVYVSYPSAFNSATNGSFIFANTVTTQEAGGAVSASVEDTHVTVNNFGTNVGFGPNLTAVSDLPSGDVQFKIGASTLTFTNVQTPSNAQLVTPTGRIMPFIKFTKTVSTCSTGCTFSGVDYKWMKKTVSGWDLATATELAVLVDDAGGYISILKDNNTGKRIGIRIPSTSVQGTIDWTAAHTNELTGVSEADFLATTSDSICHLGLSYDDKIGMRYFETFSDSQTCP